MTEADHRTIEDARAFLVMMSRAYSEIWRRRFMGEPPIEPSSVVAIFDDCQFHRRQLEGVIGRELHAARRLHPAQREIYRHLDPAWRSLYLASIGKLPRRPPPRL